MKAVLSNRIYLECTNEYQSFLDEKLTYSIPPRRPTDPPIIIKNMGIIRAGLVTIPIGRTDLIPEDYEIKDKRNDIPVEPLNFKFTLRDSQQSVYDEVQDSCIINAWVSWGKTFTALAIANKLQQKNTHCYSYISVERTVGKRSTKSLRGHGGCDWLRQV